MDDRPDPFEQAPSSSGRWPKLEQLAAPPHQVLSDFIHGCSRSPADRTAAVTTLTLTLWQLAGGKMSTALPSLITIDAVGSACAPGDLLAAHLLNANGTGGPRIHHEGHFMGGTPEQAPIAMAKAILAKRKLGKITPQNASLHNDLECRYFAAQRTGFGCGPARAYSSAWDDTFELIAMIQAYRAMAEASAGNLDEAKAFLAKAAKDVEQLPVDFRYHRPWHDTVFARAAFKEAQALIGSH